MKTKIYKALSVLLTLAMIFSACVCVVSADTTAQDVVEDGKLYPAMATGTVNGVNLDAGNLINSTTSPGTVRLYTVNTYEVADFESITVPSGCRAYVQTFLADGTYKGGGLYNGAASWLPAGTHSFETVIPDGAVLFKVTFGDAGDAQIPSTEGFYLTLNTASEEPENPETPVEENVYYVSVSGSDETGNGSAETPYATVNAALTKATEDGVNVAGKTVTIKVSNPEDTATNLWGASTLTFDCDLILLGEKANTVLNSTAQSASMVAYFKGAGSLTLKNIKFTLRQYATVRLCNKDIYLEKGSTWALNGGTIGVGDQASGNSNANDVQNIVFKSTAENIHIGATSYTATFANRFNFVYDVAGGSTKYTFGCPRGTDGGTLTTTYKNDVNFNIKEGSAVTFGKTATHLLKFVDDAQIQIINAAGATISGLENVVNTVSTTDPETNETVTTTEAVPTWIINVPGYREALDFTAEAGVYTVKEGYTVTATKEGATEAAVVDATGELDLRTAGVGTYNISVVKEAEQVTYYVQAGATDGDGTQAKPLANIGEVIAKAKEDGIVAGDTVTAYALGTDAVTFGTLTAHAFDLIITSDGTGKIYGGTANVNLMGDVTVDNVTVDFSNKYNNLCANGNNLIFTENAKMGGNKLMSGVAIGAQSGTTVFKNPFTVDYGKMGIYYIYTQGYSHTTYNANVNVIYNAAGGDPHFYLSSGDARAVYNAVFSVEVKAANSITFVKDTVDFGDNGAYQVLNHTANKVDMTNGSLATVANKDKFYIYNNTLGTDVISLTDEAGVLNVNFTHDKLYVVAIDEEGNVIKAVDGKLTLDAGVYTIKTMKDAETPIFYVGTSEDTSITTYATVVEAVQAAVDQGYIDVDTVTIKVLSDVAVGGTLPKYAFDLIVEGSDVLVPADPEVEGSVDSTRPANIDFTGNATIANNEGMTTTYKNVTIVVTGNQWPDLYANSSNLVMEDSVVYNAGYVTIAYGTFNDGGTRKTVAGQTVEINGNGPVYINLSNPGWSGKTYTDTVRLILDIKNTHAPNISINAGQGGVTNYKDIFINIKDADGIGNFNFTNTTETEIGEISDGLYILNSAGINLNEVNGFDGKPAKTFVLTNITGIKDIVDYTGELKGEFLVNFESDVQRVVVTDSEGAPIDIDSDGYFYLEKAGEYTLALECIEHQYDHACDADCNNCGDIRETEHVYDHDCDTTCNVEGCGFTRETEHVYDNVCDTECNVEGCGATREAQHVYDNVCDTECNTEGCGATREAQHVYDHDCDTECNTEGCGFTRVTEHVYDHACDTECNVAGCGFTREIEHVYDNVCDTECNVEGCGATREVDHVYDNACDTECNTEGCGATREAQHVFDHDCDTECNTEGCGFTRDTEHVFDHDCDTTCNVAGCGFTRVTEHVFDDESDKECNVEGCGFTRALGAELREEGGVTYYYYDGVKSTATGIVEYEGKQMYINAGRFLGKSGLVTIGTKKMYINKGYFTGASGLVTVSGKKMYINKGYFTGASGLVTISGKKMYINKGYFTGASGLVTVSGKKMYINKGYFTGASGLVTISGKKMYINKGYFTGATGIVKIGSKRYYINKGYFLGKSGTVTVGGKKYKVVKGIVQ